MWKFLRTVSVSLRVYLLILTISLSLSSGFYGFLFAHPILLVKNSHWFNEKKSSDSLTDADFLNDINRTQAVGSLKVLKHQLAILSKLYRKELQFRQPTSKDETA